MIIAILKETAPERRVCMTPDLLPRLKALGAEVWVESGAGVEAYLSDSDYARAGAELKPRSELLVSADLLISIQPLGFSELEKMKAEAWWVGVFQPLYQRPLVEKLLSLGLTSFSLDMIPRTTRAQAMDVLSSQATVAGYLAVLEAARRLPRFFPMLMTAAGSIAPAKVLVIGAGVAGLQAIATARRLGAVVDAFDTRPEVKEEVQSLGARFVDVEGAADASQAGGYAVEQTEEYKKRQAEKIAQYAAKADVIITTAQIPGRKAPLLITEEMVKAMKPGSVIVDLAAASGGNCALTENNKIVQYHGVTIVGQSNFPSEMPGDASRMFAKNVYNFLNLLINKEKGLHLNLDDDIVAGCCITHKGQIISGRVKEMFQNQMVKQ
ncbi:MAG: Re/Si-specific NAD(P)(+) transhydrogenase subunit alpha [Flavobacteriales bacterium]|nr:Re/Si-specific NAD(P)(+) transhydrogenase subunit alpha [Flavobacteriales bacterium]MCX7767865.1 Re/Si-specific NAD(P)(+) transhydrogenase subunit alpha [Flavobacteriales bacterium]MDW8410480.1 Re/Si-specific NAD(P)(+) transhydrogenase subunit alpha [Flavobacteriales bacterium]